MKLAVLNLEQCQIARQWRNECLETLRTPYPLTEEMQAQFYHEIICNPKTNHRYWAIIDEEKSKNREYPFIGMGGITNIQWENRIGEISLIIDPALRGKGYGKKAVELLLDAAFNQTGLNCVYGEYYLVNTKTVKFWTKITEKYGRVTTLRARKFWDGKFFNSIYFDILKDEYDRAKPSTTDGTLHAS